MIAPSSSEDPLSWGAPRSAEGAPSNRESTARGSSPFEFQGHPVGLRPPCRPDPAGGDVDLCLSDALLKVSDGKPRLVLRAPRRGEPRRVSTCTDSPVFPAEAPAKLGFSGVEGDNRAAVAAGSSSASRV